MEQEIEELSGQEKIYFFLKKRNEPVSAKEIRAVLGINSAAPLRKLVVKRKEVVRIVPPFPIHGKVWYVVAELAEEYKYYWVSDPDCLKRYEVVYAMAKSLKNILLR